MKCKNCGHPIIEFKEKGRWQLPKYTRLGFYHWFDDEEIFDKPCGEEDCNCTKPEPKKAVEER